MVPGQIGLLVGAMMLCFARSLHAAALGEDCSAGGTACDDPTAMVCDPTDNTCRVKADGTQTDCSGDSGLCPENAACGTDKCTCNAGFVAVATGLCTVQDADCSSDACGDTTNYVCDPDAADKCKVKADGVKTDCSGSNPNCATHATCAAAGTCSCDTGYKVLTTGLCTVQDADCSRDACGDTTNYVCDPDAADKCKVKADGVKTDCSGSDPNCATHATCAAGGTCSCDTGYKVLTTGLCTAVIGSTCEKNAACSSVLTNSECVITYPCTKGVCACSSGYGGTDCLTLGYDKTCSTSADKCDTNKGLACDSGTTKCACSSGTYRSEIGECTDQKLLGESCSSSGSGNCYTANTECDTTCKCSSGYYQDGQACRRPYADETCSATCDSVPTAALLSPETSQQTPTCTASKCDCGTNEKVSRKIGSTCYTVCLSQGSGTTAVGQTCAKFNDCESKVCAECPGDAGPKCYNAPCSGSTFSGSILVCSIILFSIFI